MDVRAFVYTYIYIGRPRDFLAFTTARNPVGDSFPFFTFFERAIYCFVIFQNILRRSIFVIIFYPREKKSTTL